MKIIFVIPSMAGGGAERVISILANYFVGSHYKAAIVMTAGDTCVYGLDKRVELVQAGEVSSNNVLKRLIRVKTMRNYFRKNRDGIIVAFGPDAGFFSLLSAWGLHMPVIMSERNNPEVYRRKKLRNFIYRKADTVVFQTADAMNYFPPAIRNRGVVIENPLEDGLPEPYHGERKKTIVSVGRLEEQKNPQLLLRAFQIFSREQAGYTLHMYGKGSLLTGLQKTAVQLGISEKVIFEGFHKDALSRIRDAGMYVLSSDYEGISNSLLEAMAVGLPVISTDCPCGGSRLCIQDGVNGLLVPVGDEKALAAAMKKIANSPEAGAKMGKKALEVRRKYGIHNIAGQWIRVLEQVIKE